MIALCIGNRKSLNEFNEYRIELPQRHISGGAIAGFGARRVLRLLHAVKMRSGEPKEIELFVRSWKRIGRDKERNATILDQSVHF